MRILIFISLIIFFGISCKTEVNTDPKAVPNEKQIKKPLSKLAEKLYINYTPEPKTQDQKDENALIDYAIDNELDVSKTASGLYYTILKKGVGPNFVHGQPCKAHYKGYFLDGKVFDASYKRGEPLFFTVGQMNAAWNEGLKLMNTGTIATLLVPSRLGYGERGFPGYVPPNTPLIFDLEVLPLEK